MEQKTDAQKTILIVEDEKNIVDILRFNLQPDIQILKDPVCCIQRRIREPPVRYDLLDNRVHCENRVVYSNPALPVKSSDIVSVW